MSSGKDFFSSQTGTPSGPRRMGRPRSGYSGAAAAFGLAPGLSSGASEDEPKLRSVMLKQGTGLPGPPVGHSLGIGPLGGVGLGQLKCDEPQLRNTAEKPQLRSTAELMGRPKSVEFGSPPAESDAIASRWTVSEALQPLPPDFILERTSRTISGVNPVEVSTRISEILRIRSVSTVFDNEKGKAKCKTCSSVCFRIRLYSAREVGGVIVEVQRRRGDCISFMKECRAIFKAAEGDGQFESSDEESLPNERKLFSEMICLKQVDVSSSDPEGTLAAVEKLLLKGQRDAKLLALESLVCLTDSHKSCKKMAEFVASAVVRKESAAHVVSDILLAEPVFSDEENYESDCHERMRNHALETLSNSLCVLDENGRLVEMLDEEKDWVTEGVVPALVGDVRNVEVRPHQACVATKCLTEIAKVSPSARERAIEMGAMEALAHAKRRGSESHAGLEKEVERSFSIFEL